MIQLLPLTDVDYRGYLKRIIPEYAAEKVQAGNWTEAEALERSRQEFERLLPQGVHTPGNVIDKILDESGDPVGILWYELSGEPLNRAFILDFEIYAPFRRHGYASQALAAMEEELRTRGVRRVELHVFGSNTAARELYKKVGFIETNVNMAKQI